jgi:hypothetical protein
VWPTVAARWRGIRGNRFSRPSNSVGSSLCAGIPISVSILNGAGGFGLKKASSDESGIAQRHVDAQSDEPADDGSVRQQCDPAGIAG